MSTTVRITPGTAFNLFTTELNTLANNKVKFAGGGTPTVFDNTLGGANGDGALLGDFFQTLGGSLSGTPAAGCGLYVWLLRSNDGGTTFEKSTTADGSTTTTAPLIRAPDYSFNWGGLPAPPTLAIQADITMPTGKFQALAWSNGAGVSMAASGNVLGCVPKPITNG